MTPFLEVRFEEARVGILEQSGARLRFRYDAGWLVGARAFALSWSLPLGDSPSDEASTRFFGNLLPEGGVRTALCRRLGISGDNDFALLEALGRDCAGALVLVPPGGEPSGPGSYRRLEPRSLRAMLATGTVSAAVLGRDVRLSLAGAQDKIAVRADGGRLFLPVGGAPSTHVLKLPNRDFPHLVANELFVMRLARAVGLPVPNVALYEKAGTPAMLVERYDRAAAGDRIRRRHQEDLCQALAVDRARKYEIEGGPTFSACYRHVRERSRRALDDTRALLSWIAFSTAVGNRDNHAKNLSMVRRDDGAWELAPFYDQVCTLAYPRVSRGLALSIGGDFDGGNLSRASFAREAKELEIRPPYLLDTVARMVAAVRRALPEVSVHVATELGTRAPLEAPLRAIRKATRALERALVT